MSDLCVVCHNQPGPLCPGDENTIDRQLESLPGRLAAVTRELLPGSASTGERVGVSPHVHSRAPGRLDALSLTGPGGDVPIVLHPLVRHWSAKRKVLVTTHVVGYARTVQVEVTDWFHEAVLDGDGQPVMVPDDDQIGTVPPREWLDLQVRLWRHQLGHHVPPRTRLPRQRHYLPAMYRTLLHVPHGHTAIAFLLAAHAADGAFQRLAYRGLLTDPELEETERRDGEPPRHQAMRWDVDYLRTWLSKAAGEPGLDIAAFAAQLGGLHAEISRVLGETPDQEWIGRCPAFLAELDPDGEPTGRKRPCGAGLRLDNTAFAAQVQCPRCRMVWDTRGHAGAGTAREIRRVWPIDRRRRYNADEIDRLTPPKCSACGKRVRIEWRDVTGTRDPHRTWQPIAARCDSGCDEARRVL